MTLFDQRCLIFIKLFADCWLQVDDEIGAGAGAEARRVFHFVISYIFLNDVFFPFLWCLYQAILWSLHASSHNMYDEDRWVCSDADDVVVALDMDMDVEWWSSPFYRWIGAAVGCHLVSQVRCNKRKSKVKITTKVKWNKVTY